MYGKDCSFEDNTSFKAPDPKPKANPTPCDNVCLRRPFFAISKSTLMSCYLANEFH